MVKGQFIEKIKKNPKWIAVIVIVFLLMLFFYDTLNALVHFLSHSGWVPISMLGLFGLFIRYMLGSWVAAWVVLLLTIGFARNATTLELWWIIVGIGGFIYTGILSNDSLRANVEDLREELEDLRAEVKDLRANVEDLREELEDKVDRADLDDWEERMSYSTVDDDDSEELQAEGEESLQDGWNEVNVGLIPLRRIQRDVDDEA
jgi:hypothetical protein